MLNSDLPIQNNKDDKLNRSGFATDLATAIINRNTPDGFVIGMYGEWGSGKTSVINMVVEQLELQRTSLNEKIVIMRFNPWLCADQKQLVSQFFKQLSSRIMSENTKRSEFPGLENICGYMNNYAEVFEFAGELPTIGAFLKPLGKLLVKVAKEKNDNIQVIKDKISKNLLECKLRIVVTIDDIDRLSNKEIISVFQLVKSLADFPFMTYLLAFDRKIVTRALGEVQNCDGANYLEKIIQAPFELPTANFQDISNIFFDKLNSIIRDIPENKWDKYYWLDLFHYGLRHYLDTIRNAVRLINTFSLKYAMVKNEVNLIDLIGLTFLQVFEPEVYSRLLFNKEMLYASGHGNQDEPTRKKNDDAWNSIVFGTPENRHDRIKNILCHLFPNVKYNFKSGVFPHFQRHATQQEMRLTNSIATPIVLTAISR